MAALPELLHSNIETGFPLWKERVCVPTDRPPSWRPAIARKSNTLPDAACPAPEPSLAGASRGKVAEQWKTLYGTKPPTKTARSLLLLAVAFRQQERAHGGLKPSLRRQLLEFAAPDQVAAGTKAQPGTVLIREWHGINHTVTVLDKGVTYEGKLYRSLTEVAEVITGNHWSGPTFFGLKKKAKA